MQDRDRSEPDRGSNQPTLYLMVGLPGAGKTTRAKEIEATAPALRLTPDDWILTLYGPDLDRPRRDAVRTPMEALQWQVAERALRLGCSVVLDWGFWTRAHRDQLRAAGAALGARVELVYLATPIEELWARIARRDESQAGTLGITRAELEEWSSWFEPPMEGEMRQEG